MTQRLFVYGTLRRALAPEPLRALLASFAWEGAASVAGRLYDLGAYPGVVLDPGSPTRVHGELARLPGAPSVWELLDRYEGVEPGTPMAGPFRRVRCRAVRAHGGAVDAWVYEYTRHPGAAAWLRDGRFPPLRRDTLPRQGDGA